jgi:hypothetical protein
MYAPLDDTAYGLAPDVSHAVLHVQEATAQSYTRSIIFSETMSPTTLLTSYVACDLTRRDQCQKTTGSQELTPITDEGVACAFIIQTPVPSTSHINKSCSISKPGVNAAARAFLSRCGRMGGEAPGANPAARAAMLQAIDTGAAPSSMDRDDHILDRFTRRSHRGHIAAPATARLVRAADDITCSGRS